MEWWVGLRTGEDWMVDVDSGWGCRAVMLILMIRTWWVGLLCG